MSKWLYQGSNWEPTPEELELYHAFVYCISNVATGKLYVGKKRMSTLRTLPPLKGQKKKRKVIKESDWREYTGSNDYLNADIAASPPDAFKYEILHLCTTPAHSSYLEAKEQFLRGCLELSNDECYNGWIMARINKTHLPIHKKPKPEKKPRTPRAKKVV